MGAVAALTGLYYRATKGGSYWGKASLVQYNIYLMALGEYPAPVWREILSKQDPSFQNVRYNDSVDHIGKSALKGLKRVAPWYWNDEDTYLEEMEAPAFGGKIKVVRPVVKMARTRNGFNETSRPNGWDKPEWWVKN